MAYLQPGDEDPEFINMLMMVRELNEYSRCLWGDTEIIAITCELQSKISKTLNGATHFLDRPYWDDSHNNNASVDRFDDDKAKKLHIETSSDGCVNLQRSVSFGGD